MQHFEMLKSIVLVAVGAAGGGVARYALASTSAVIAPNFPYGTIAANLTGSLVAGILLPMITSLSGEFRLLMLTGFLGGLTTMSGFALETIGLYRDGQWSASLLFWGIGAIGSILACMAGVAVSSWFKA